MIRVGIIGTESSHANAFARYFITQDPFAGHPCEEDIRVTAVWGDAASAAVVAFDAGGADVMESVDTLLDAVDAVMITLRRGSAHKAVALRAIDRSLPLFLDKPITSDPAEAAEIAAALRAHPVLITGGSGCKFCDAVQTAKSTARVAIHSGTLLSAFMSFDIMMNSEYDGFWFYAPHLVEMCLEIFGSSIESVSAIKSDDSLIAALRYPGFLVSLHFTPASSDHRCVLVTKEESFVFPLDISDCYLKEASRFAQLLRGEWSGLTVEELIAPVTVIDAIIKAAESGQTVRLGEDRIHV